MEHFHVNTSDKFPKISQNKRPEYSSPCSFVEIYVFHNKHLLAPNPVFIIFWGFFSLKKHKL